MENALSVVLRAALELLKQSLKRQVIGGFSILDQGPLLFFGKFGQI